MPSFSSAAIGYFLTFRTYGTWLPGDVRGAVDHDRAQQGPRHTPADPRRASFAYELLKHPPTLLGLEQRRIVAQTFREVAAYRGWSLPAANVRTNHGHLLLGELDRPPKRAMLELKGWATRRLREAGLADAKQDVWAEHGSTRWIWTPTAMDLTKAYVVYGQGLDLGGLVDLEAGECEGCLLETELVRHAEEVPARRRMPGAPVRVGSRDGMAAESRRGAGR